MDMGRFLVETHLRTGKPIGELAGQHGVSRSWLYKLLCRYRREGPAGLEPRSRRPKSSPNRISDLYEEEIVSLRKELTDMGFDAGAETIRHHMLERSSSAPSTSTIWRVLKARGFVTPHPKKRPKSSYKRFVADLPNERWQADVTHVTLENNQVFEVLNMIDDHSRLCTASRAFSTVTATDVVRTLNRAGEQYDYPASMLTDNGLVFTAERRYGAVGAFEQELFSLGISSRHSRPYHPQTCGKVERFHQTLKKFLEAQEDITTKKQLQASLDRFVVYYNEVRPHRAIGRRTPAQAFASRQKAFPKASMVKIGHRRVRQDKVDKKGAVTLRYKGRIHHIGIGAAYKGWKIWMLVDGRNIEIVTLEGTTLRKLKLDPTKDYQPIG